MAGNELDAATAPRTARLVDPGGHAEIAADAACPWSIYEAAEYVERLAADRTAPLADDLHALFPPH